MNRRNFLQATGLGLAAASLPGWLQACAGRGGGGEDSGALEGERGSSEEALAMAKRNGRPLLVFVVPVDVGQRYQRGQLLGVYLNRADDEAMAELALCGIWCATPGEIRSDLSPGAKVDDATLAVLIETGGGSSASVPDGLASQENSFVNGPDGEAAFVESVKARNALVHERLHAVIAPDKATLRRRADEARSKFLPRTDQFPLGTMGDSDEPNASHVKRVPAWVLWRAEHSDAQSRAAWVSLLANDATRRWRSMPPPRMHWARSLGCGCEVEGAKDPQPRVACGMAFIPEYSSRFLTFFSEEQG